MATGTIEERGNNFINNCIIKFGKTFDYSKVDYKRNNIVVTILCTICNNTFEQTPANHLYGFNGCKVCVSDARSKAKLLPQDIVIEKYKKVHGEKYDYSLVKYVDWHTKVKIICPHHGIFEQESNSHSQGNACPECGRYKTSKYGGMTNLKLGTEPAHLYLVYFKSENYEFIKVGLTSRNSVLDKRFGGKKYAMYDKEIILDIILEADIVIKIEALVLQTFYDKKYFVKSEDSFKGCSELFKFKHLDEIKAFMIREVNLALSSKGTTVHT